MNKTSIALAIIGLLLGLGALWGLSRSPEDAGEPAAIVEALTPETTTTSTTLPPAAPTTTTDLATWTANGISELGALDANDGPVPVGLRIDALAIDAPVGAYGVDSSGQMDVPNNITDVGWYKYGASPGEPGSAVLAAHVDLRGPGRGLFWDLDTLEPGARVTVDYSDGSVMTFEVTARATYLKDELPLEAIFSKEGPSVLTLVTCGGGFSTSDRRYDSNVVVYAVPVDAEPGQSPS